jgi:PAS domain S-box-containing protein
MEKAYDLFMLLFNLSQLHNKERVISVFIKKMNEIFHPTNFTFSAKQINATNEVFEIKTIEVVYGYIEVQMSHDLTRQIRSLLVNAIQMLAMILENLDLNQKLTTERDSFEQVANQRMEELGRMVKNLERARSASINLIEDLSEEIEKRVKIEKNLRESEEKYRRIAENINDVVWTTDLNLKTTYISPSVIAFSGETPEQHAVRPLNKRYTKQSLQLIYSTLSEEIKKEKDPLVPKNRSRIMEVQQIRPDGKRIWTSMNISFIRDNFGNPIGLQGVTRDITDQKLAQEKLRESEEKYRLIFERSPLGVIHFTKEGKISDCNENFVEIIGSSRENLIGLELLKLSDPNIGSIVNDVLKGKSSIYEGIYKSVTSQKITPVRMLFSPIIGRDGNVDGGIGLVEDRSSHVQKEEFKKQVEVVQESAKFKQNFLANMSHEIRTPLTGVLGMIDIMEQTTLSEKQQEYLNILKHSGENLKEIINQVLDFSKIEAGKVNLNYTPFEFKTLTDDAHKLYTSICRKDVDFSVEMDKNLPEFIKADKNRISQVVNNLVSNAVKFTHKGKIILRAGLVSHIPDSSQVIIKIEVEDSGIGIPIDMQKKLFIPFSQIDENDTRVYEGTGLGLSICKELVNLHGGDIGVISKHLKGSVFWFTFRAEISSQDLLLPPSASHITSTKSKHLNILFAEDKVVNQKVVSLLLKSLGHEVTIAKDGKEALEFFETGKYDLILMDIQMPVMDGITATRKLKSLHNNLPPVVGLSANAFEGDREKYMALGMDGYLTKPVKRDDFNKIINQFFS